MNDSRSLIEGHPGPFDPDKGDPMSLTPFLVVVLGIPVGMAAIIGLVSMGHEKGNHKSSAERKMQRLRSEVNRLNSKNVAR